MAFSQIKHDVIVIGIDFGTTFSGVSFASSESPTEIEVITRWDAHMEFSSDREKSPTAILYHGPQSGVSWGYGIPPDADQEPLRWFKLLLVDEGDLPDNLRHSPQIAEARRLMKAANKDPVDVISGYLRRLWNHSVETIGIAIGVNQLKQSRFHVVITLPAIWPDYAKARMRRAAHDAGLIAARPAGDTSLSFISEPEAAALATAKDLAGRSTTEVGDHFVVCDAGGGTVDLISYEVVSINPTVVREAIEGDGELCGGVFLDEAFVKLMQRKVTKKSWNSVPKEDIADLLNVSWENGIKKQFTGTARAWSVKLPYECQTTDSHMQGTKRKRNLILSAEDLVPVFDPIAQKIGALVQKQIDGVLAKTGKLPKNVTLVGGFGRCQYIRTYLLSIIHSDIALHQSVGTRSWTAICRGATIQGLTQQNLSSGLSVSVRSRISRESYGIQYRSVFDPLDHDIKRRVWCPVQQDYMVEEQMEWFLEQGTDVSSTQPVRQEYYHLYASAPEELTLIFYVTSAWPSPTVRNDSVKKLCTVNWTKKIDFEALPRYVNPLGKVYHKLTYTVEMTCAGASIDFAVIHDGKQVGSKNISVDFENDKKEHMADNY